MRRTNMRYRLRPFLLCILFVEIVHGMPTNGTNVTADIDLLFSDFWDWIMYMHPVSSSSRGYTMYNDRMETYSLQKFDMEKVKLQEFMTRLEAIDRDQLNKTERIHYDVFNDTVETYLEGNVWARYGPVNPINNFGLLTQPYKPPTANTAVDFENYIARLQDVRNQVDGLIDLMRYSIQMNRTLHNVSMTYVVSDIESYIHNNTEDSPFYNNIFERDINKTDFEESKREDLRQRCKDAVVVCMDAYRDLRDFLVNEYLPNTRTEWGLWAVDETNGFYKACLNYHLSSEMDPAQVHSIGLVEVERIKKLMHETIQRIGKNESISDFYDSLKSDERFFTNNATELMQKFNETVFEKIVPKLDLVLDTVPEDQLILKNTTNPGFLAYYTRSKGEATGNFYVGIARPNDTSFTEIMSISMHEGYPGHHVQMSYQSKGHLPDFRGSIIGSYTDIPNALPFYTASVEGWGLYSEYLGEEMGLYETDYDMMGRYTLEILRACRLVVDTGIHYMRWTRPHAIQYMMNCSSWSQFASTREIDRYITLPGQACAYKIGEMKIIELRQYADRELGSHFDLRHFHRVVLETGSVSLRLLDRVIKNWVKEEKAKLAVNGATPMADFTYMMFNCLLSFCILGYHILRK